MCATENDVLVYFNNVFCPTDNFANIYEYNNSVNVHGFASHMSYSPTYRFTTLTLVCEVIAECGLNMEIRCLLDNASNVSIIRRSLADALCMRGTKCDLQIGVTGGETIMFKKQRKVRFWLKNLHNSYVTEFPIEATTMPSISQHLQQILVDPKDFDYLEGLTFTEPLPMSDEYYEKTKTIDLLLGVPYETLIREPPFLILGPLGSPNAHITKLGNCLSVNNNVSEEKWTYLCKNCELDTPYLTEWLRLDNLGIEDPSLNNKLTFNEYLADQIMNQKTTYNKETNQYTTVLPWIDEPIRTTNVTRASATAARIIKKYMSDDKKWKDIIDSYQAMWNVGHIELVPPEDLAKKDNFHYIQTFPVWDPKSATHKCRIVFQANQVDPETKKSLNSHFLTGKNNIPEIPQLLIEFRTHVIAGVTDVSRMFNRFLLHDKDKDFLRFFFCFEKPDSTSEKVRLKSYRCRSLPFGLNCSPYICTYLLQKHASEYIGGPKDKAARFITTSTYMDDCSFGSESIEGMKKLLLDIQYIFNQCSLPTHKYFSNSAEALEVLSPELCSANKENSVLGSLWNSEDDTLSFNSFLPPVNLDDLESEEKHVKPEQDLSSTVYTKRMMLSQAARVYDANGFISPFVLVSRLLLQRAWMAKVPWDDALPEEIQVEFKHWVQQIPLLKNVKIDRLIVPKNGGKIIELCVFNDACATSFATCVYAIAEDTDGNRMSSLVFSKSKVKPLKKNKTTLSEDLSIPRMELLGCEIGARAGNYVRQALKNHPNIRMRYFTDSLVSLYRISNNPGGYKVWVGNRILGIQGLTSKQDWFFVAGEVNRAADISSRGADLEDFVHSDFWLHGPPFLTDKSYKYITVDQIKLDQKLKQIDAGEKTKVVPTFHLTFVSHQMNLVDENQLPLEAVVATSNTRVLSFYEGQNQANPTENGILFLKESWGKTVRIFGWILRFVHKCKAAVEVTKIYKDTDDYKAKLRKTKIQHAANQTRFKKKKNVEKVRPPTPWLKMSKTTKKMFLTSEEQICAEEFLFRYAQFSCFGKEISQLRNGHALDSKHKLFKLMPFWSHDDKFLRMRGRLPGSNLILLPPDHRVTTLYIRYIHKLFGHCSVPHTMYRINQRYHVIGSRRQIKKALLGCLCKEPKMLFQRVGNLPAIDYLDPAKNHYFIMIDYCGPFHILNETTDELEKTWACVFTCLVTRAITVKLLRSCSTENLILGIKSYVAHRGRWQIAFSDSAKYFKCAANQLKAIMKQIDWDEVKSKTLTQVGMEWTFNCPLSPHRSGHVESMVKLVKIALRKTTQNNCLTFEKLSVVFEEITAVVNSRPLGYVSSNSGSDEVMVSPNILCHGRNVDILPTPLKWKKVSDLETTNLAKLYHSHQIKMSLFWKTYYDVYFNFLKFSKKWHQKLTFDIPVGTFILVKEPSLKKYEFKTGRVLNTIKGRDGLVRTLEIKFAQNKHPVFRSIQNCALLEHDFLKLQNDDHPCSTSHKSCLLSSPQLDAFMLTKKSGSLETGSQ